VIRTVTLNPALDRTLLCENLIQGEVNSAEVKGFFPAGKGINVSRCLAALEVPSAAYGFIGKSEFEWYSSFLEHEGISAELTPVQGITRINTTIISSKSEPETHIKEKGFSVTRNDIDRLLDTVSSAAGEHDTVIISGSLPPGFKDADLIELIQACRSNNTQVYCDLSGSLLRSIVPARPSLIKPNTSELEELTGSTDMQEMLEKAYNMGFEEILHTRGEKGCVYFSGREIISAPSPSIDFVNSVGAGDAALAGYIAALYKGLDTAERVKWAAVSGAANSREQFAGVIDKEWVSKMLAEVQG
jgi:1-phosphofructokinase